MSELTFTHKDTVRVLEAGEELTFGRDTRCDVVISDGDLGVSRVAGVIRHSEGVWWLVNLSATRALHVIDDTGYSIPLPVTLANSSPTRRPVFAPGYTVLLAGEVWTYNFTLATDHIPSTLTGPLPAQGQPTKTGGGVMLTDKRKEALVALVSGYLVPYPRYNPRPLSYAEAAAVAGLDQGSTVRRRIEDLRKDLREIGVPGLNDGNDAPRRLAEWVLSTRMVTPADLAWLERRKAERPEGDEEA